eukprot:scaffold1307_cov200-Pinguiococcus_pyrenoidosus.AAC.89
METVLLHPSRPPPEEYHATTNFDALCYDASEVLAGAALTCLFFARFSPLPQDLRRFFGDLSCLAAELALPGPVHASRRLCVPLLIGVACIRCMSTSLATMLDRLPQLSYGERGQSELPGAARGDFMLLCGVVGVAKEHHALDFPHFDIPLPWKDARRRPPTTLEYAAGFPLCHDEIGFDFTPGLLSEKSPAKAAALARKVLKPNPTFLALVPEPVEYVERRLEKGVDLYQSLHEFCKRSSSKNDCWIPSDVMAWFRTCIGSPTRFRQTVPQVRCLQMEYLVLNLEFSQALSSVKA